MQLFNSTSIPLLLVFLSLLSISTTTAAPKASSPPPAVATPDDKCHPCLTRELRTVPKCDLLSPSTPALPSSENNPVVIQRYKDTYPDAVDCLCSAAKWIEVEGGPQDWISRCNNVCTVAVFKNQKRILEGFQKQLSCGESVGGGGSASRKSPPAAASQNPVTPPVRKPANEATPALAPPAAAAAPEAKSVAALKPKEVAATKSDPKPAAKESAAATTSNSNTTPDTKGSKAGGDAKPTL